MRTPYYYQFKSICWVIFSIAFINYKCTKLNRFPLFQSRLCRGIPQPIEIILMQDNLRPLITVSIISFVQLGTTYRTIISTQRAPRTNWKTKQGRTKEGFIWPETMPAAPTYNSLLISFLQRTLCSTNEPICFLIRVTILYENILKLNLIDRKLTANKFPSSIFILLGTGFYLGVLQCKCIWR